MKNNFQVGDIIRGVKGAPYAITDEKMEAGRVIKTDTDGTFTVKITGYPSRPGEIGEVYYNLDPQYFELIWHSEMKPFNRLEALAALAKDKSALLDYDLSCADLSGSNLSGSNLRSADLSGSNLRSADLSGSNLSGSDLSGSDLSGSDLSGSNLSGSNLSGSNLRSADLSGSNLRCADLSGSNLRSADLRSADLSGSNLRSADLSGSDLSGSNLRSADLSGSNLSGSNLRSADLSGSNLSGSNGIMSAIAFMDAHFERTPDGFIAYKTFGSSYSPNSNWKIEPGSVLTEVVNPDRTCDCGCGINVAPLGWVKDNATNGGRLSIWKVLIRWEWLMGVVVPFGSDGKVRCEKVELIEVVK